MRTLVFMVVVLAAKLTEFALVLLCLERIDAEDDDADAPDIVALLRCACNSSRISILRSRSSIET